MKNVICTINAFENALILSEVAPNYLNSRIVHIRSKELSVLFAVTKKNNDVELEEGITIEEAFDTIKKQENAELSDADLDDVSGGIAFTVAAGAVACFVAGGAALSFLGGYAYQTYKNYKKK